MVLLLNGFKVILGQKDNVELSYKLHKIINKEYKEMGR